MKKHPAIPALALLLSLGTSAQAQGNCGQICTQQFWATATQAEIEAALRETDPNAVAESGAFTPLHFASAFGSRENIETLLEAGADVNARAGGGQRPLHNAAAMGTPENVLALIEAGADVNLADGLFKTPLHYASSNRFPEIILLLLEAGADANARDFTNRQPVEIVRSNEHLMGTAAYRALIDAM